MEHSKSMLPSQLMAERGADVVVINPGSENLRIGLASAQVPLTLPHCVAHLSTADVPAAQLSKGSVPCKTFRTAALSEARASEREDVCQMVERQLNFRFVGQGGKRPLEAYLHEGARPGRCPEDVVMPYSWTDVRRDRGPSHLDAGIGPGSRTGEGGGNEAASELGSADRSINGRPSAAVRRTRIFGEEALSISAEEPYNLRRPMCRGHLNISRHYSLQQVCDDLFYIWDWALTEKLGLSPNDRQKLVAVLVVPDTLDTREMKELISVLLKELQFSSAVVHQECVAATLGNGLSSACVVNLGAHITSVMCVEDGVAYPSTQVILPFGGEDISRCFLWVQKRWKSWPSVDCDPLRDPLALLLLNHLKEVYCLVADGDDHTANVTIQDPLAGRATRSFQVTLAALNVPPMGLFYPTLLAPEELTPLQRPWYHVDQEDPLDDLCHQETSKKSEVPDAGSTNIGNGNSGGNGSSDMGVTGLRTVKPRVGDPTMSLSQAIVNSIMSLSRPDLQKKMFSSLQLVGGVALTKGLVDAIEERVLQEIPATEAVDTVDVLANRTSASFTAWKGGAIMGVLDSARDTWIQKDDWLEGGVRVGSGRKYKDSNTLQAQTFWYCSISEQQ